MQLSVILAIQLKEAVVANKILDKKDKLFLISLFLGTLIGFIIGLFLNWMDGSIITLLKWTGFGLIGGLLVGSGVIN